MSRQYDEDILTWSEQQAVLLRRLATGERVNDQIDWEERRARPRAGCLPGYVGRDAKR